MIPDQASIESTALAIERQAHRSGWDQPALLLHLRAQRIGDNLALEVVELPFRDVIPSGNPAVYLRQLADQFGDGHLMSGSARQLATASFVGLSFVSEAWMRTASTREELENTRKRSFADIPGSLEIRQACIVDVSGRVTYCIRQRGSQPEVWSGRTRDIDDCDPNPPIGGRVPGSLRDMVLAVALQMPFGSADLDAIRAVRIDAERG